jgi:hypothetical protein
VLRPPPYRPALPPPRPASTSRSAGSCRCTPATCRWCCGTLRMPSAVAYRCADASLLLDRLSEMRVPLLTISGSSL